MLLVILGHLSIYLSMLLHRVPMSLMLIVVLKRVTVGSSPSVVRVGPVLPLVAGGTWV